MRRALLGSITAAVVALGATPSADAARAASLPSFDTCSELVQFARRGLTQPAVPVRALPAGDVGVAPRAPLPEPAPAEPPAPGTVPPLVAPPPIAAISGSSSAKDAAPVAGQDFSGTNIQEDGIDEPDVIKTDGRRLFVVVGSDLWAFDVTAPAPRVVGKVSLEGAGGELLLRGDRVLVIGPAPSPAGVEVPPVVPVPAPGSGPQTSVADIAYPVASTRLAEVDVRDPAAMKISRTMLVPGQVVSARLSAGTIRIVMNSPSTAPVTAPSATGDSGGTGKPAPPAPTPPTLGATHRPATERPAGLRAFVPRTTLRSRVTRRTFRRALVPCANVRHPTAFEGLDLLTVLTIDFDRGLFNVDRDAVLAGAQVVYASDRSLYVASSRGASVDPSGAAPSGTVTELHRFDASERGQTTYASSGTVPGFVLGQYALSEWNGDLRVASTKEPLWLDNAQQTPSTSAVTVLRQQGTRLVPVGQVDGLGRGERIYAARFIGDAAYLVTFRQIDPLYTLDLRDPAAPKVVGELKIAGYSAYLHPIGDGLLLGVGSASGQQGQDAQASIFDASNPAAPTRLAAHGLGSGFSTVEFDPHAFLWWAPRSLAVLPVSSYDPAVSSFAGAAVGLTATRATGLTEVGRVTHGPAWDHPPVLRSLVVGDRLLTLSDQGLATTSLPAFAPVAFTAFAGG